MKNLFEIDKEKLLQSMDDAVTKKEIKMVLSNSASQSTGEVNKTSMSSWVKSSPFFVEKKCVDDCSSDDNIEDKG